MKKLALLLAGTLIATTALADHHEVEAEVLAATRAFNDAYAANDLDGYFGYYSEDAVLVFDQERTTVAEYDAMWHELIAAGGGVESVEMSDIEVVVLAGGQSAAVSYRAKTATRNPNGDVEITTAFETDLWERRDDGWKVVLLHFNYLD